MSDAVPAARATSPTIDDLIAETRAQTAEIVAFASALPRERFLARSTDGRWSVGEHLSHLALTIQPYVAAIDGAVERSRAEGWTGDAPYRGTVIGRWFLASVEPPVRMAFKTVKRLVPADDSDPAATIAAFEAAQSTLVASLERARGVDLGRTRVRSPFFPLLRMAAIEAYRVVLAHNRRHLWLARRGLATRSTDSRR